MQIGIIKLPSINAIQRYAQQLPTSEVQINNDLDIQEFLKVDFDKETQNIQKKTDFKLTGVGDTINLHIYKDIKVKLQDFENKVFDKRSAEREQKLNNAILQSAYKMVKAVVNPESQYRKNKEALEVDLNKEYNSLREACDKAQKKQNLIRALFAEDSNYEENSKDSGKMEEVAKTFCLQGKSNGLCILAMLELCKEQEKLPLDNLSSYYSAEYRETLKLLTLLVTLPKIGGEFQANLDPSAWMQYLGEKFPNNPEYQYLFSCFCISGISEIQKSSLYDNLSYQDIKESLKGLYYNALLIQLLDVRGNNLDTEEAKQTVASMLDKVLSIPEKSFPVLPNSKITIVEHENFRKLFKLFENDPKKYWDHFKQKSPLNKLFTQVSYLCDDMIQLDLLVKGAEKLKSIEKDSTGFEVIRSGNDDSDALSSLNHIILGAENQSSAADEIREKYSAIEKKVEALKELKTQGKAEFPPLESGDNVKIDITSLKDILKDSNRENLDNEEDLLFRTTVGSAGILDNLINIKAAEEELKNLRTRGQEVGVNFEVENSLVEVMGDDTSETLTRQDSSGYGSDSSRESTPKFDVMVTEFATNLAQRITEEALQNVSGTDSIDGNVDQDYSSSPPDLTAANNEVAGESNQHQGLAEEVVEDNPANTTDVRGNRAEVQSSPDHDNVAADTDSSPTRQRLHSEVITASNSQNQKSTKHIKGEGVTVHTNAVNVSNDLATNDTSTSEVKETEGYDSLDNGHVQNSSQDSITDLENQTSEKFKVTIVHELQGDDNSRKMSQNRQELFKFEESIIQPSSSTENSIYDTGNGRTVVEVHNSTSSNTNEEERVNSPQSSAPDDRDGVSGPRCLVHNLTENDSFGSDLPTDSNQTEVKQAFNSENDSLNESTTPNSTVRGTGVTSHDSQNITVVEQGINKTGSETITTSKKGNKIWYALALAPVVLLAALVIAKVALSITSFLGENLLKSLPSLGMNNPVINKENIVIFLPIAAFLTLITCAVIYCAQREKPGSSLCGAGCEGVNEVLQH